MKASLSLLSLLLRTTSPHALMKHPKPCVPRQRATFQDQMSPSLFRSSQCRATTRPCKKSTTRRSSVVLMSDRLIVMTSLTGCRLRYRASSRSRLRTHYESALLASSSETYYSETCASASNEGLKHGNSNTSGNVRASG